jgi:hypothetical protein
MQSTPDLTQEQTRKPSQRSSGSPLNRLLGKVLARLGLRPLHKHGYLMVYPLDSESAMTPQVPIEVVQVMPEDTRLRQELADFSVNTSWFKPETVHRLIADFFEQGDLCFIGRTGGQIVSRVWITVDHPFTVYSKDHPVPLRPDQVYYYDAYTAPEFRGKNIYHYIKVVTSRLLRERYGKRYAISYIEAKNTSSLNAQKKIGTSRAHKAGFVRLLGRKFYYGWRNPIPK